MASTSEQNIVSLACNYLKFSFITVHSRAGEVISWFQSSEIYYPCFFVNVFFSATALHSAQGRGIHQGKSGSDCVDKKALRYLLKWVIIVDRLSGPGVADPKGVHTWIGLHGIYIILWVFCK